MGFPQKDRLRGGESDFIPGGDNLYSLSILSGGGLFTPNTQHTHFFDSHRAHRMPDQDPFRRRWVTCLAVCFRSRDDLVHPIPPEECFEALR